MNVFEEHGWSKPDQWIYTIHTLHIAHCTVVLVFLFLARFNTNFLALTFFLHINNVPKLKSWILKDLCSFNTDHINSQDARRQVCVGHCRHYLEMNALFFELTLNFRAFHVDEYQSHLHSHDIINWKMKVPLKANMVLTVCQIQIPVTILWSIWF